MCPFAVCGESQTFSEENSSTCFIGCVTVICNLSVFVYWFSSKLLLLKMIKFIGKIELLIRYCGERCVIFCVTG